MAPHLTTPIFIKRDIKGKFFKNGLGPGPQRHLGIWFPLIVGGISFQSAFEDLDLGDLRYSMSFIKCGISRSRASNENPTVYMFLNYVCALKMLKPFIMQEIRIDDWWSFLILTSLVRLAKILWALWWTHHSHIYVMHPEIFYIYIYFWWAVSFLPKWHVLW